MVVYYINKTSDTVNECGFPVKQGDICLLLLKFDVKTIYIDSPVETDSIWRDFRFLDNKSLKSVQFPKKNAIICRPASNGKATGDAVLLQNLIESCTGEWLKDFLSETLSILNGFNTYWDIGGLKRFTRDDELVEELYEVVESETSSSGDTGNQSHLLHKDEPSIDKSEIEDMHERAIDIRNNELVQNYRNLLTFCQEALHDFNPGISDRDSEIMRRVLRGEAFDKIAEDVFLTRERIRQIFTAYVKKTRENHDQFISELYRLREENRQLRYLLETKGQGTDAVTKERGSQTYVDRLLSKDLENLDLTVRAKTVLRAMGVNYLAEIPLLKEAVLLNRPNCGRVTIKDIKKLLAAYNLRLDMTRESMMYALTGEGPVEVEEKSSTTCSPTPDTTQSQNKKGKKPQKNFTKYYCIPKMGGLRTETSVRATRPLPADEAEVLFRDFLCARGISNERQDTMVNALKVDFAELVNTHIQPEELSPFFSYTSVYGIKGWFDSLQYLRPMEYYDPVKLSNIKEAVEYYIECLKDDRQVVLRTQLRDEFENSAESDADDSSINIKEAKADETQTETQLTTVSAPKEPENKVSLAEQKSQNERENSLTCDSFEDYLVLHYSNIQVPFKLQILGKVNKVLQEIYGNETEKLTSYTDIEEAEIVKEDILATDWYQHNVSSMQGRITALVDDYLNFLEEQKKTTELAVPIKDSVDDFIQSLRVIEHNVRMIDSDDTSAYDYLKYYSEEIDKIQRKIDNYQIILGKKTNKTLPQEELLRRLHAVKQLAEAASLLNESTIYDMLSQIDYGNPVKCEEFSLEEVIAVLNNWDSEVSSQEETNVMAMPISTPTFEGWLYRPDGAPVWTTFHVLPGTNPETDGAYWYALTIDGEKMPECLAGCIGVNVNDEPVFVDYGRVALTSDRPISQGGDFDHKDKYLQAVGNGIPRAIYDRIWFGGKVFGYIIAAYRQVPDRKEGLAWLEKHFQKES